MLIKQIKEKDELINVRDSLSNLRDYYEGFKEWFDSKVLPLKNRFVFAAFDNNEFAGALILKKEMDNCKVCTLYVRERNRFNHIGGDFLRIAHDTLQTNKLPISISDEVKEEFFNSKYFNFVCEEERASAYKNGVTEYFGYLTFHENYGIIQFMKAHWKGNWHLAAIIKEKEFKSEDLKDLEKLFEKEFRSDVEFLKDFGPIFIEDKNGLQSK